MKTFDALLEQAYAAGAASGRMQALRDEGYAVNNKPTFAEWRQSIGDPR